MVLHHLSSIRRRMLAHIHLCEHLAVHHHLVWIEVALLELSVLLLELVPLLASTLHIGIAEILVPLLDREHDLAALVPELDSLLSVVVFVG